MKERSARDGGKKAALLRIGLAVFTERGFHNTSIDEIAGAANVPKGSFAYYYGSKDAFTLAVIEAYREYFNGKLDRILGDKSISPIARLRAFTDDATLGMERFGFKRGCLVGNLGQELGGVDEKFRSALLNTLRDWQERVRLCLEEAKAAGELLPTADSAGLARVFWYAWEGAVLAAKLEKSRAPLDSVSNSFLSMLAALAPPAAAPRRRRTKS